MLFHHNWPRVIAPAGRNVLKVSNLPAARWARCTDLSRHSTPIARRSDPCTTFPNSLIAPAKVASSQTHIRSLFTFSKPKKPPSRVRNGIIVTAIILGLAYEYYTLTDTRSSVHRYIVPAFIRLWFRDDAEGAHAFGIEMLKRLWELEVPLRERGGEPIEGLSVDLFNRVLPTPVMISAGLDKHAEAIDALFNLSPSLGLLEIGCVTPEPQFGNPKPRVFRLPTSESIINRYGFNSHGSAMVARRLRTRVRKYAIRHGLTEQQVTDGWRDKESGPGVLPASLYENRLLAIQIGKNLTTSPQDLTEVKNDYVKGVQRLGTYADLLVVNVSSPNTPGLRTLQQREPLTELLKAVVDEADKVPRAIKPKILVKVSPDEDTDNQISDICAAIKDAGVAGVIVANTTTKRPPQLTSSPKTTDKEKRIIAKEIGGLSGPALLPKSLELVGKYRRQLDRIGLFEMFDYKAVERKAAPMPSTSRREEGKGVIVLASGGITNGEAAIEAMKRGAGGVMVYTGLVYGGVGLIRRLAEEMKKLVQSDS